MSISDTAVQLLMEAGYRETHARLAGDPEYLRLKTAAEAEEDADSPTYFARNMFAIFIEAATPLPFVQRRRS